MQLMSICCPIAACTAETKHPAWHNALPALKATNTTIKELIVDVLNSKGYAASAPFNSTAWRARPIFLQSFEINSLKRLSELTPIPSVYLLDDAPDPETRQPLFEIVSDANLAKIKGFVSTVAPYKGLFYRVGSEGGNKKPVSTGLVENLKQKGFMVHTYTLRDEAQFVLPTCGGDIACEFRFLFQSLGVDGGFADYPATLVEWVKQNYPYTPV
jgi:glycerophosphoryl diester phosphodiesterase